MINARSVTAECIHINAKDAPTVGILCVPISMVGTCVLIKMERYSYNAVRLILTNRSKAIDESSC